MSIEWDRLHDAVSDGTIAYSSDRTELFAMLDEAQARLRAAEEALEKAALRNCIRRKNYPAGPTCASPVPGEGLPRDKWCYACEAREVLRALSQNQTTIPNNTKGDR